MDESKVLEIFEATELDMSKCSDYEKWALNYFHKKEFVSNPFLDFTLQLDITGLRSKYDNQYCKTKEASFTAYLVWSLFQAIKEFPCLSYRKIDGRWYHLKNLPLFFPVAVDTKERFHEIYIENVFKYDWEDFCKEYSKQIEEAKNPSEKYTQKSEGV